MTWGCLTRMAHCEANNPPEGQSPICRASHVYVSVCSHFGSSHFFWQAVCSVGPATLDADTLVVCAHSDALCLNADVE